MTRAELSLDGDWRFRLEDTDCTDDETRCQGIVEQWFAYEHDDSDWRTLAVPGHFTRQIPIEELGGRSSTLPFHFAWYRRHFTPPTGPGGATYQHLRVVFGAVDYRADVWIDGLLLTRRGSHLGTFNPFAFDLPVLNPNVEHVLVVRVQKPLDPGILSCGAGLGGFTDLKINIDGTKGYHDSRPGANSDEFDPVAKQALHTGGIVQPVRLVATGELRLDWVFVTALPAVLDGAHVLLSYTVTNLVGIRRRGTITTRLVEPGTRANEGLTLRVELDPGANRIEARVHLDRARLWFPAGHPELGEPALYRAETSIAAGWAPAGGVEVSDARTDRFGIRSLGLASDRCEDRFAGVAPKASCADDFDYTDPPPAPGETPLRPLYQRFVNGKRIFAAGAGGIPSSWVAEVDRSASERFLWLLRAVNGNHLNLHAQVATPASTTSPTRPGSRSSRTSSCSGATTRPASTFVCGDNGYPRPRRHDPARGERVVETARVARRRHGLPALQPPLDRALGGAQRAALGARRGDRRTWPGRPQARSRVVDVMTGIDRHAR